MSENVNPRRLQPNISFESKDVSCVLERNTGFGKEFISGLVLENADLVHKMTFLKDPYTDDVWGFYSDGGRSVGFQVDPDCEVIIVWANENEFKEFGAWIKNPENQALSEIKRVLSGVRT